MHARVCVHAHLDKFEPFSVPGTRPSARVSQETRRQGSRLDQSWPRRSHRERKKRQRPGEREGEGESWVG